MFAGWCEAGIIWCKINSYRVWSFTQHDTCIKDLLLPSQLLVKGISLTTKQNNTSVKEDVFGQYICFANRRHMPLHTQMGPEILKLSWTNKQHPQVFSQNTQALKWLYGSKQTLYSSLCFLFQCDRVWKYMMGGRVILHQSSKITDRQSHLAL